MPDSLPERVYLLAYDRDRDRLRGRPWLGYTLRAAVLADLAVTGHVADAGGRVAPVPAAGRPVDPVQRALWEEITTAPPRSWEAWIRRDRRGTAAAVAARLEDADTIRVEPGAHWWRRDRVDVVDRRRLTRLDAALGAALRGPVPVDRLDPRDTALIALLATGEVRTAIDRHRRREYAERVRAAIARTGPPVAGLKRALRTAKSQGGG